VFLSDHGYHLGDHTFWQKNNLHEQVARVPLIISVPGLATGRTQSIVELVDIFPTVTELVGVPRPAGLHGTSLVPVLRDPTVTVKQGALSIAKGYSWRVRDWAYMRYNDQTEELYDMRGDPHQLTNLAGMSGFESTRRRLATELDAKLRSLGL
jgi:iduronate 2-sulfatase